MSLPRISESAPRDGDVPPVQPPLGELFLAFVKVALQGFGGALPWARRMMVDEKRWLTADEFNEDFALSQFLPGPNAVNFSVVFGSRFGGGLGALVALAGLLGPPFVIISVLAALYTHFGDLAPLGRMLSGVAAAAVGLLMATVAKMAVPLIKRRDWAPFIALAAFVGVALLRWPLLTVLVVLAPVSIALAWFRRGTA